MTNIINHRALKGLLAILPVNILIKKQQLVCASPEVDSYIAQQSEKVASAYLQSKQALPFDIARQRKTALTDSL